MKKSTYLIVISLVFLLGLTGVLSACGKTQTETHVCQHVCPYCGKCTDETCTDPVCADKCTCAPLEITHTTSTIMTGTRDETAVHKFVTNREGPKIVIVGGTHGDEKAGWSAALQLIKILDSDTKRRTDICGEILIIPQVNINADKAGKRYLSTVNGVTYSDLNRSYPVGRESGAATATIAISNAVISVIEAYAPDYVVDLHESRSNWENGALGDSVISDNKPFFMEDLLDKYNTKYLEEGETEFINQPAAKDGSFSKYFTDKYPNKVVFTVETNRQYAGGTDNISLSTRVRQQLNILNAMFDLAWDRNYSVS